MKRMIFITPEYRLCIAMATGMTPRSESKGSGYQARDNQPAALPVDDGYFQNFPISSSFKPEGCGCPSHTTSPALCTRIA